MKKVLSVLATGVLVAMVLTTTTFASHHGGEFNGNGSYGGHHTGEYSGSQSSYNAPQSYSRTQPSYSAPRVDSVATVDSAVEPEITFLAAAVCEVEGCTIIGEHTHDDGAVVAHYYGDGHDNHGEYDHYYGDGHDYHDQYDHSYGDGHENHNQYDHSYGDGHTYHTSGNHAYHAGELHH